MLGSIIAERLLDVVALGAIFVVIVYGVLGASVLPTDRPILAAGIGFLMLLAVCVGLWVLRRHHVFERVREWLRPLADAPRALLAAKGSCCSRPPSCCGRSRRASTTRWRAPSTWGSA